MPSVLSSRRTPCPASPGRPYSRGHRARQAREAGGGVDQAGRRCDRQGPAIPVKDAEARRNLGIPVSGRYIRAGADRFHDARALSG